MSDLKPEDRADELVLAKKMARRYLQGVDDLTDDAAWAVASPLLRDNMLENVRIAAKHFAAREEGRRAPGEAVAWIVRLGLGEVIVDTGTHRGVPSVFIEPAPAIGKVGDKAKAGPLDSVQPNSTIIECHGDPSVLIDALTKLIPARDEAALPEPEWTRYDGKGRPVPNGTPIEIQQRDGKVRAGTHWSEITWSWSSRFPSEDVLFWRLAPQAQPVSELPVDIVGMVDNWAKEAQEEIDAHCEWLQEHAEEPDPGMDHIEIHPNNLIRLEIALRPFASRNPGRDGGRAMSEFHPFVFCAHITKAITSVTMTNGARGGIYWATSEDAARGALAKTYLDDGFTVQILEVSPIEGDGLARLAAYHAALSEQEKSDA